MDKLTDTAQVWRKFEKLPLLAKQQVVELIMFLSEQGDRSGTARRGDFRKKGFVGMWKDREDMKDSSSWVREVRTKEWGA